MVCLGFGYVVWVGVWLVKLVFMMLWWYCFVWYVSVEATVVCLDSVLYCCGDGLLWYFG